MTRVNLLMALRDFTLAATKDFILPTSVQAGNGAPEERAPEVYITRLPDERQAKKLVPYILHQVVTSRVSFQPGQQGENMITVRSVFCVYDRDAQKGGLALLSLMDRMQLHLCRQGILVHQYRLDLSQGLESMIYPDDIAPYFAGEMLSVWDSPFVNREVEYEYHPDPKCDKGPICMFYGPPD